MAAQFVTDDVPCCNITWVLEHLFIADQPLRNEVTLFHFSSRFYFQQRQKVAAGNCTLVMFFSRVGNDLRFQTVSLVWLSLTRLDAIDSARLTWIGVTVFLSAASVRVVCKYNIRTCSEICVGLGLAFGDAFSKIETRYANSSKVLGLLCLQGNVLGN